ncbi:MAG: DUF2852 domain-containing protein [Devosiaceae bacterium]|nr:DUF2852 domain-containing protein [Devosiaceae bacterium]
MSTAIIKPEWSFITITLMVLGFILFWPLGLAMLAYILWGERFGGTREKAERWVNKQRGNWKFQDGRSSHSYSGRFRQGSGNAAFDAYREEQLDRLNKERQRLDDEVNQFQGFVQNLRMARDREEFDRFMRDRSDNQSSKTIDGDMEAYTSERKSSKSRKSRKD